ncbi:rRNA-processing protein utp23 [Coniochaeta hoffmannii]|uniref:U three protein 23 n=1 Tax=Coniochaeta hoffmannii TaxID=91930 RepID=A0AA38RTF4_9PEZI|nr:rRNA-processing protein utp23 [Coniochaeta hoffmannii]
MRGKRSKQYRKLIQQYTIHFGFREPYQVIVDADFVKDTTKCKMDLQAALERTLHGTVKPLITQCSIRHLYASNSDPSVAAAIEVAKNVCERRRCGHHPDTHPQPLSTLECLSSVIDPAKNGTNKHRYCVASQEMDVRRAMRAVKGVPLIYVNRSVMILEPMPDATRRACEGEEKGKLRDGFVRNVRGKTAGEKRKRDDEEGSGSEGEGEGEGEGEDARQDAAEKKKKKKKKKYGKKEPNPLSVRKPKKKMNAEEKLEDELRQIMKKKKENGEKQEEAEKAEGGEGAEVTKPKRKRRRRHKAAAEGGAGGEDGAKNGEQAGGQSGKDAAAPVEAHSHPAPNEAVEA